jgi:hypothetical protein
MKENKLPYAKCDVVKIFLEEGFMRLCGFGVISWTTDRLSRFEI